jgi:DNA repair protein RecO (recombination protein O)
MSHHIYQTRGFIIDSTDVGEANKLITIFTEDLGLLRVAAQGVRLTKSKLRPSIQNYSFSKVSLVKGKEYWRLTNADKLISLYDRRIPISTRKTMIRILLFIRRMMPMDVKHSEVFELISNLYSFMLEHKTYVEERILIPIENLATLRILDALGYGNDDVDLRRFSLGIEWSEKVINESLPFQENIQKHIQNALESSHL